jgi:predicted permease
MTLRNDLFLAKVLNTELKYQYLKNTPRFQKSDKKSVEDAKRYLSSNVRSSLYVNTVIYGSISVLFGFGSVTSGLGSSNESFILFLLLLILAIMSDTQFYRGVWDMRLLTPLNQLPLKVEKRVVPFSLFFYNEFYLPFVTIPAGVVLSIGTGNPLPIIIFSIFTLLFIYLARLVSLLLGVTFVRTNTNRKTKRLYLGQIFQVLIFVIFILAIEVATNPSFQNFIRIPQYLYFLIPVGQNYISAFSVYPFAAFLAVFAIVYPAYLYIQKKSFTEKMETFTDVLREQQGRILMKLRKPVRSLIDKDFKILFRRRGAIMIMVIPITFIIPIIPMLLSSKGNSSQLSLYIPYLSSIFLIEFILLIGLEGKAAWHLSSLPITRRQYFFSKLYSIFTLGLIYYALLIIVIAVANRGIVSFLLVYYPYFALILAAILFTGGTYLVKAIPKEVYSLSQQGLGGRWIFLKTFIIGLPVIIINVSIFEVAKYLSNFKVSYYLRGYTVAIIVDALISYLFLRLLIKRGDHF